MNFPPLKCSCQVFWSQWGNSGLTQPQPRALSLALFTLGHLLTLVLNLQPSWSSQGAGFTAGRRHTQLLTLPSTGCDPRGSRKPTYFGIGLFCEQALL